VEVVKRNMHPEVLAVTRLSGFGANHDDWLHAADHAINFLKDNAQAERVTIYASAPHVLIHGVLAPLKN
jgi:hypothetical protein